MTDELISPLASEITPLRSSKAMSHIIEKERVDAVKSDRIRHTIAVLRKAGFHVKKDKNGLVLSGQCNVLFDCDASNLKPEAKAKLDAVKDAINSLKQDLTSIGITGHTCNKGSKAHNKKLSEDRAQSVYSYLAEKGIDAYNPIVRGKGFDAPVATNNTEEGRKKNRRVEISLGIKFPDDIDLKSIGNESKEKTDEPIRTLASLNNSLNKPKHL